MAATVSASRFVGDGWRVEADVDGTPALNEYAMRDRAHVIANPAADTGRAYTEPVFKMNNG